MDNNNYNHNNKKKSITHKKYIFAAFSIPVIWFIGYLIQKSNK